MLFADEVAGKFPGLGAGTGGGGAGAFAMIGLRGAHPDRPASVSRSRQVSLMPINRGEQKIVVTLFMHPVGSVKDIFRGRLFFRRIAWGKRFPAL